MAKTEPATAIQVGRAGGRLKASSRPVITALPSESDDARRIARRQSHSVSRQAATQTAARRSACH